jgi:hypothetical protein
MLASVSAYSYAQRQAHATLRTRELIQKDARANEHTNKQTNAHAHTNAHIRVNNAYTRAKKTDDDNLFDGNADDPDVFEGFKEYQWENGMENVHIYPCTCMRSIVL